MRVASASHMPQPMPLGVDGRVLRNENPMNRVRAGRQQLSVRTLVCRRSPGCPLPAASSCQPDRRRRVRFTGQRPRCVGYHFSAAGEVRERPNRTVSKTVELQGSVGSNPTLSARRCRRRPGPLRSGPCALAASGVARTRTQPRFGEKPRLRRWGKLGLGYDRVGLRPVGLQPVGLTTGLAVRRCPTPVRQPSRRRSAQRTRRGCPSRSGRWPSTPGCKPKGHRESHAR